MPLFGDALEQARGEVRSATPRQLHTGALRGVIDGLVSDLIETTGHNIRGAGVASADDVRAMDRPLVGLSPEVAERNGTLKRYLRRHLYRHHRIERMKDKARRMLHALFERYHDNPRLLPDGTRSRVEEIGLERSIADYIAGMTDRYAIEEYQRLFDPRVRP